MMIQMPLRYPTVCTAESRKVSYNHGQTRFLHGCAPSLTIWHYPVVQMDGALKLIHLICFMPDPEKRALPLDIRSLRSRSVDDEDMKIAIHWLESMSSCNDNATMEPLEVLIALLEEQCLPSRARNYPSSDANFSWPLDGDGQFTVGYLHRPIPIAFR
jgi:hypothetical protein